ADHGGDFKELRTPLGFEGQGLHGVLIVASLELGTSIEARAGPAELRASGAPTEGSRDPDPAADAVLGAAPHAGIRKRCRSRDREGFRDRSARSARASPGEDERRRWR